ncbi:hypothetical protein AAHE18_06G162500 [Arachis hypogaea]
MLLANSAHIPSLFAEHHDNGMGGHSGYFQTYKRLVAVVFWKGMQRRVKDYVATCSICQQSKYIALKPAGLLQPLPIPKRTWEHSTMDFVVGLPKAKGMDTIFVVVNQLSKYAHFIPLSHPFLAKVAAVFITEVVKLHEFPKSIVSYQDRVFMSRFWSELFQAAGTKLKYSTTFHPQMDGQTKVVNRCLETYLRCFVGGYPKRWLEWAKYWFNTRRPSMRWSNEIYM